MAYQSKAVTLSAAWTITGSVHADDGIDGRDGTQGLYAIAQASVAVALGGVGGSGSVSLQSIVARNLGGSLPNWTADASATNGDGPNKHKIGHNSTVEMTGNATISVPCLLCYNDEGQSPNPFAGGVVDAPFYRLRHFYLLGSGDAKVTISVGPVSDSGTIDVRGQLITPTLSAACSVASSALVYPVGRKPQTGFLSGTASISATLTGCTFSLSDESINTSDTFTENHYSNDDDGNPVLDVSFLVSATSNAGGASVSATCSNGGQASSTSNGEASRSFDLSGVIRAMLGAYPDPLTLSCSRYAGDDHPTFNAGSTFSRSYIQRKYTNISSSRAHTDNSEPAHSLTLSKDEFQDVGVSIVRSSLTANGDEPLASRILMRGKQVGGLNIAQAATFSFDDFASGWTGTVGASVSHDGAGLHITTGGGATGGATVSYSPARSMASYRYLRVPLKSTGAANVPLTLTIGGYRWNLTTGADGELVTRDVDMCAPTGGGLASGASDTHDTRWPTPTAASATSGPIRVDGIAFRGIPASRHIDIGPLLLARHDAPTVDCMPTLYASEFHPAVGDGNPSIVPEWALEMGEERLVAPGAGTTSQDYVRRFLLANSDGRQAVEETDFWYTRTEGGETQTVSYSFNMDTLQGLCDQINATDDGVLRNPGWTATVAVPVPTSPFVPGFPGEPPPETPYYFNAGQLLAAEVYGGGILFSQDGPAYGFDLPVGDLPAAPLFDGFRQCGLEGNLFGYGTGVAGPKPGGGVDAFAVRGGTILRGGAQGQLFSGKREAKAGETVNLKQGDPAAIVSSGISRVDGYYHADNAPAAKASKPATVTTGTLSASIGNVWTRHRHRVSFVLRALGKWLTGDASMAGRLVRGSSADDLLMLEFASDITAQTWSSMETDLSAFRPCLRYSRLNGALYASFQTAETGGAIAATWTRTEGRTFDGMATINDSGEFPTFCHPAERFAVPFWRTDDGAIQSKIVSPNLVQVYPAAGAVLTPVLSGRHRRRACRMGRICDWQRVPLFSLGQRGDADDLQHGRREDLPMRWLSDHTITTPPYYQTSVCIVAIRFSC